jgi:hypothetical protein
LLRENKTNPMVKITVHFFPFSLNLFFPLTPLQLPFYSR